VQRLTAVWRGHRTSKVCGRESTVCRRRPPRRSRLPTSSNWSAVSSAARWRYCCSSSPRWCCAGVVGEDGDELPSPRRQPQQPRHLPGTTNKKMFNTCHSGHCLRYLWDMLPDWVRSTVGCVAELAERRSLAGELTLSCARPSEDG